MVRQNVACCLCVCCNTCMLQYNVQYVYKCVSALHSNWGIGQRERKEEKAKRDRGFEEEKKA